MRRQKPLSVKVKAPSRGLISRFPGLTADKFLSGQMQFNVAGLSARASTVSSNVRYEDGVVCAAPGYDLVNPGNAGGSPTGSALLSGIVAHWAMDELSGTRFDSTAAHRDLAPVGGSDPQGSLIVGSAPGELNLAAQFPDAYNPAGALQDYSMDQAIYEPITDTIFGVRGQWLFQFNATNGNFIQGIRFTNDAQSPTSIATDGAGKLFCGVAKAAQADWATNTTTARDIFVVDASTLAITRFNFGSKLGQSSGPTEVSRPGWTQLLYSAGKLYGLRTDDNYSGTKHGLFYVDPTNLTTYTEISPVGLSVDTEEAEDMVIDPVNGLVWIAQGDGDGMGILTTDFTQQANGSAGYPPYTSGICWNAANNKVYCASNTQYLMVMSTATAFASLSVRPLSGTFTPTILDTGRTTCNARRIKSVNGFSGNAYNGKLLIPSPADDTVLVWDPAVDTSAAMTVLSGFTAPFDIVIAPTKCFALQSGVAGLVPIN